MDRYLVREGTIVALRVGVVVLAMTVGSRTPAYADGFIGGLIAGHVVTNIVGNQRRQTAALEQQASQQPTVVYQQAPPPPAPAAASGTRSVEDRLQTLDELASKGVISQDEYQQRRQAILDSI